MPLFDYRCAACGAMTEVFERRPQLERVVACAICGSTDTARTVSRFAIKSARSEKYSESFRERMTPFLKSQPGMRDAFEAGGESEEAKAFKLTERIGERIDRALETKVFNSLDK